jgi:hypothetical protein
MENTNANSYGSPVNQLLTYGKPGVQSSNEWPNYLELGLGLAQIPDLIRLVIDEDLNKIELDIPEGWAQVHAWRALGQLRAEEAIEPLLTLLNVDFSDWLLEELPEVFALIGPVALPALAAYIADVSYDEFARICVINGIEQIAIHWPESRPACIASLMKQLEQFEENEITANGFLISNLVTLQANEAAPLMEQAFADDYVDLSIMGEWEDVQEKLGLLSAEELEQRRAIQQRQVPPFRHTKVTSSPLLSSRETPFLAHVNQIAPPPLSTKERRQQEALQRRAKNKIVKLSPKKNRKR